MPTPHTCSLEGKTAIITGGARGIGLSIAETYLAHGARVMIGDVLEEEGRRTVAQLGPQSRFCRCDVTRVDEVRRMVDETVLAFGAVDILVNNAAYNPVRAEDRVPIDRYPETSFQRIMDVDVNGTFYCSKYAAGKMIERRSGVIINIASVAGVVALRNQIPHVAAKAALVRMTEAMALELGPAGIRVNTISPGSTLTEATRPIFYGNNAHSRSFAEKLLSFLPLGRPGEAPEIAAAALFLASDMAAYITGHNLVVDGGWTAGFIRDF